MVISSGVCGGGNDCRSNDCSVDDDIMIVVEYIINGDGGVCVGGNYSRGNDCSVGDDIIVVVDDNGEGNDSRGDCSVDMVVLMMIL